MLNFSICSFKKANAENSITILFSYFDHLDKNLPVDLVRKVTANSSNGCTCLCDFIAGTDDDLLSLSEEFKDRKLQAHRMVILWYLSCCEYKDVSEVFIKELLRAKSIMRLYNSDVISKIDEALDSWSVDFDRTEFINNVSEQISNEDTVQQNILRGLDSHPGVVVVDTIGDIDSREGKDLKRRYEHIIKKKLPYKGDGEKIAEIHQKLIQKYPWAENVVDFICGQLALMKCVEERRNFLIMPPFLLEGNPGGGKTRFLKDLCELISLPVTLIACGGTADSGGILPVARGWATARVSGPVQAISEGKCANPVIILDEIDKASRPNNSGQNGSVTGALLSMIGGGQECFYDNCLMADVNLSGVGFTGTANDRSTIPEALKDRFMILKMPDPKPEDFDVIFKQVLLTRQP